MTALSPGVAFTRGFYDTITDGDYTPPEERLISGVPVYRTDEPGLVGVTGDLADNAATGICAFTPSMTAAIQRGENPVTGASMDTYADVRRLMYRDLPELSQVADQFGCTGMDGTIAVVLEDEEWAARTCRMLDRAGIDSTRAEVQSDIRDLYGRLVDTFETYTNDVLGNEATVEPIYTSDATEAIDDRLWAAAREVGEPLPRDRSAVDDSERYRQRINMYFTPFWLDLVEQRLGLSSVSLIEPVRFLDELLADVGGDGNIFAAAQQDYFTADDREYEIGFVAPQLDLSGESDDLAEESRDAIYAGDPRTERLYRERARTDPFRGNPVVRTLTAFPQRQEAMTRLAAWRSLADGQKREAWPEDASQQGFEGRAMGDYFDVRRAELAERLGAGDRTVFDQAFEVVQTDIATVMEAAR